MKKKYFIGSLIAGFLLVLVIGAGCGEKVNYDDFAKCLTDSGVKMYGAYWCSHCQNQKKMFGNSWEYINYVECSLPNRVGQTEECRETGIKGYPTWEFQDGKRIEGKLSFEQLSQYSNCETGE